MFKWFKIDPNEVFSFKCHLKYTDKCVSACHGNKPGEFMTLQQISVYETIDLPLTRKSSKKR